MKVVRLAGEGRKFILAEQGRQTRHEKIWLGYEYTAR